MTTQSKEAVGSDNSDSPTFEQQVNTIVSTMTRDVNGNYQFEKKGLSEEVVYAANAERRRRSTESALGKTKTQLKAEQTVTKQLKTRIVNLAKPDISIDKQVELDELKYSDPEAWHKEMNKLEFGANTSLQTELGNITSEASQQAEKDSRESILSEYNKKNPDFVITDEVVENDIPPRITNKLTSNKISFEEFLLEARDYLKKPKKIGSNTKVENTPNLGNAGGGSTPSKVAINGEHSVSYDKQVF